MSYDPPEPGVTLTPGALAANPDQQAIIASGTFVITLEFKVNPANFSATDGYTVLQLDDGTRSNRIVFNAKYSDSHTGIALHTVEPGTSTLKAVRDPKPPHVAQFSHDAEKLNKVVLVVNRDDGYIGVSMNGSEFVIDETTDGGNPLAMTEADWDAFLGSLSTLRFGTDQTSLTNQTDKAVVIESSATLYTIDGFAGAGATADSGLVAFAAEAESAESQAALAFGTVANAGISDPVLYLFEGSGGVLRTGNIDVRTDNGGVDDPATNDFLLGERAFTDLNALRSQYKNGQIDLAEFFSKYDFFVNGMHGGLGSDQYYVNHAADRVVENEETGSRDIVFVEVSWDASLACDDSEIEEIHANRSGYGVSLTGVPATGVQDIDMRIDITGNRFGQIIMGMDGANTLSGMGGDDILVGYLGADTLLGGGDDDRLHGGGDADTLRGDSGDDIIEGGVGLDDIDGGDGIDWITYAYFNRSVNGVGVMVDLDLGRAEVRTDFAPTDSRYDVDLLDSIEAVIGTQARDTILGNDEDNRFDGLTGNDILSGRGGNDSLKSGAGNDILDGGDGADTADYAAATGSGVTVDLAILAAQLVSATEGSDTLTGIENVVGSADADRLSGNEAVNVFAGGLGDDILAGQANDDTLDGGDGVDTADYARAIVTGVTVDLSILGAQSVSDTEGADTLVSIENVIGSAQGDQLMGDGGANSLSGNLGDDVLRGLGGDDLLEGGEGSDTADYAAAWGDGITVDLSILVAQFVSVGEGSDTLSGIDNVTGSSENDWLAGDAAGNSLAGGDGDDSVRGRGGDDLLDGGSGTDTADFSGAIDSGISVDLTIALAQAVSPTEGTDTLIAIENVTGSAQADRLGGDAAVNVLVGGDGDDVLAGRDNDDTLDGGAGVDMADYSGAVTTGVVVNLTITVAQTVSATEGADTLIAIENLAGSAQADWLVGDGGANALSGNFGDDILRGAGGDDALDGGAGIDTADYSGAIDTGVNVDLTITVAQMVSVTEGTDTLTSIENLMGSAQADWLSGDTAVNVLIGGDGDDVLAGRANDDTLDGGAGIDMADYSGAASTGVVVNLTITVAQTVSATEGADTLIAIENLAGSAQADRLTGSAAANTLYGGAGNDLVYGGKHNDALLGGDGADTLDGGTGDDVMMGGAGSDVYYIDSAGDIVIEWVGEGTDKAITRSFVTLLGDNVERLTLAGAGAISGVGNALNNLMKGNSAINTLSGAEGADTLYGYGGDDVLSGGAGADTLWGGDGADVFRFQSLAENGAVATRDWIRDFESGIDKIDLSGLGFTSLVAGSFTGQAGELRVSTISKTYIQGDVDGDRVADFYLLLSGVVPLTLNDFIL